MTVEVTPVVLAAEPAIPAPKSAESPASPQTRAERIAAAIEKHAEPAAEKVEEKPKPEEKKVEDNDQRLATLTRKQKQVRDESEKVKAERDAFNAHSAKAKPILAAMEALNPEKPETVVALLDTLGSLRGKQAAEFMDEIAEAILAQPKPQPSVEEIVDQKLQAKADEEAKTKAEEEEKFTQEQFKKQKDHIRSVVQANSEKYELLQDEPAYEEQVFQAQLQLFQSTGKLYPIERLLDELESSLEQKILKYKKVSALTKSQEETSSKAAPQASARQSRSSNPTVSYGGSTASASQPLTRAERVKAAIAKAKSL